MANLLSVREFFSVARRFMAGSQMLRQLYFSALDMELHIRYGAQNNSSWHEGGEARGSNGSRVGL